MKVKKPNADIQRSLLLAQIALADARAQRLHVMADLLKAKARELEAESQYEMIQSRNLLGFVK